MGTNSLTRWGFLAAALLLVFEVRATTIQIDIFTGPLGLVNGSNWDLAFDLFDGGNSAPNSATISDFAGATVPGTSGYPIRVGDATGDLPGDVTLIDTVQSTYIDNVNIGAVISFVLKITENVDPQGFFPDAFAFSILYPGTQLPIDPSGLPLLVFTIGNDNQPEIFCPDTAPRCVVVTPVPEPGALALAIAALLGLGVARAQSRKISPPRASAA